MDIFNSYDLEVCANFLTKGKKFPRGFWNRSEESKVALGTAILQNFCNMHNFDAEFCKGAFTNAFFQQYELTPILRNCFGGSIFSAYKAIFPDSDVHIWEMASVPQGYWTDTTARQALTWLFTQKEDWTREEALAKFTYSFARDYKLSGILDRFYASSPSKAVREIYS